MVLMYWIFYRMSEYDRKPIFSYDLKDYCLLSAGDEHLTQILTELRLVVDDQLLRIKALESSNAKLLAYLEAHQVDDMF